MQGVACAPLVAIRRRLVGVCSPCSRSAGSTLAGCANSVGSGAMLTTRLAMSAPSVETMLSAGSAPATSAGPTTSARERGDETATTTGATDTTAGTGEFLPISGVPVVSDEQIVFSALGTASESSPLGGCNFECYVEGIVAYFVFRNDQGDLHGRELVLSDVVNDQLANNQVKALEIIQAGDTFGIFSVALLADRVPRTSPLPVCRCGPHRRTRPMRPEGSRRSRSAARPCISCATPYYVFAANTVGANQRRRPGLRRLPGVEGLRRRPGQLDRALRR